MRRQERTAPAGSQYGMSLMRLALVALMAIVLAPLLHLALVVPPNALINAYRATIASDSLRTSLVASLGATVLATALGVPAGYALARGSAVVRTAALAALALPLALPPVAIGVALLGLLAARTPLGGFLVARGVTPLDSLLGVGIAMFAVSGSIVAIVATAAFLDVERDLEEAARTLGASPLRVAATVALPLAAPALGAGILLAWLRAIGEYGATSIVAYHPTSLPIELVTALSADGVPAALALAEAFAILAFVVVAGATLVRRRPS